MFKCNKIITKFAIPYKFDISLHLVDSVLIKLRKIICDTDHTRHTPIDALCFIFSEGFHHQKLKIRFMVKKPIKIEQALINDIFIYASLIFKNDRAVVFINSNAVHTLLIIFRCASIAIR